MKIILVLFWPGLFKLASSLKAAASPGISGETRSEAEVELGADLDISCSVLNAVEFPVLWVKLPNAEKCGNEKECGETPLTSGSSLLTDDPRFRSVRIKRVSVKRVKKPGLVYSIHPFIGIFTAGKRIVTTVDSAYSGHFGVLALSGTITDFTVRI